MKRIAVIGLGALGSAFAHVATQGGIDVVGIDTDPAVRTAVEAGDPPTDAAIRAAFEPPKTVTDDHSRALDADAAFIFVSTPGYDATNVFNAIDAIGGSPPEYPIAVCSTVPPGTMRKLAESTSATVLYNPEFVARGELLDGFTHPEPFIFGAPVREPWKPNSMRHAVGDVTALWRSMADPGPLAVLSYESAELAKLAFNTFTAIKMSWANQVALAADRHGADAHRILDAIRDDHRIGGPENLRPGLGFGGPCLPDDVAAYREHVSGGNPRLETAAAAVNDDVRDATVMAVLDATDKTDRVGCLGTAYKPGTAVTTGSEAVRVADALREHREVLTYDPMAESDVDDLDNLTGWADVLVKLVPWREFAELDPLIDCWGDSVEGT